MGTRDALEYVETRASGSLRVFATYEADGDLSIEYTRDDVQTQYTTAELRERVQEVRRNLCRATGLESKLGEQYADLRLFPNVILINIPPNETEERGLILTLDREVGRNLTRFLESTAVLWRDGELH